jgi:hypothetical protein
MCIIIDASVAGIFMSRAAEHTRNTKPVHDWLDSGGRIVYGGKNREELAQVIDVMVYIQELRKAGKASPIPDEQVNRDEETVRKMDIVRSDDPHVLALARVSHARLLFANDQLLEDDFGNTQIVPRPKGKVYKRYDHRALLILCSRCPGKKQSKRKRGR